MFTQRCVVLQLVFLLGIGIPGILSSGLSVRDLESHSGDFLQLKAVRRSSDLLKRDPQIRLTHTTELSYANCKYP